MKMQGILDKLRGLLTGFHRGVRGTTMTEFVLMTPIFIIIFVAIMRFGAMGRIGVNAKGRAALNVWENGGGPNDRGILPYQTARQNDGDLVSFFENLTQWEVNDQPQIAAADAEAQLIKNPPKHGTVIKTAVMALETNTYTVGAGVGGGGGLGLAGMGVGGHWGESLGRMLPLQVAGNAITMRGVDSALTADPEKLFGENTGDTKGSTLARELMFDGLRLPSIDMENCGTGDGASLFQKVAAVFNNILNFAGIRPSLAVGMSYGTVTGKTPDHEDFVATLQGGRFLNDMEVDYRGDYYTASMPPRLWPQGSGMATFLTRLSLEDCARHPAYAGSLGIGTNRLARKFNETNVPEPGKIGFTPPLNYEWTTQDHEFTETDFGD